MTRKLASGTRRTLVVHSRYAWRSHRTQAAIDGEQGLLIVTIEQLAARLAGGFLQSINADNLKAAVAAAVAAPLGEFDKIKALPGFQRAAAASLWKAWTAGLKLDKEAKAAGDETGEARLASLVVLEKRSAFESCRTISPATGPGSGGGPTGWPYPLNIPAASRSTAAPRCHRCGGHYCHWFAGKQTLPGWRKQGKPKLAAGHRDRS